MYFSEYKDTTKFWKSVILWAFYERWENGTISKVQRHDISGDTGGPPKKKVSPYPHPRIIHALVACMARNLYLTITQYKNSIAHLC